MKQWVTSYWSGYEKWYSNVGLLNLDTNNTIGLLTFNNTYGIFRKDSACNYKVLRVYA